MQTVLSTVQKFCLRSRKHAEQEWEVRRRWVEVVRLWKCSGSTWPVVCTALLHKQSLTFVSVCVLYVTAGRAQLTELEKLEMPLQTANPFGLFLKWRWRTFCSASWTLLQHFVCPGIKWDCSVVLTGIISDGRYCNLLIAYLECFSSLILQTSLFTTTNCSILVF